MAKLWLPIGSAINNPRTERQAVILKLKNLGVVVAGMDAPEGHPDFIETSYLRDVLEKEEALARNRPTVVPAAPALGPSKADIAGYLKERRAFAERQKAGVKRYY